MKRITKLCLTCQTPFQAPEKEIKRGYGKYCSTDCANLSKKGIIKPKESNVFCSYCGEKFYKSLSTLNQSKSGLYFCCREHKDLAQRIGGIKDIQPNHYGISNPKSSYRTLAFRELPGKCNRCGYSRYKEVLDVHHKDNNHSNNEISNLEILCPTCHVEGHFLRKSGRFTGKS